MVHPDNAILFSTKKKKSYKAMKRHERNFERRQSGYILYDSNYMTFWKRQNYGDSKKINGHQGLGGKRDEQAEQRIFRAVKLFCY